jgi:hypothetical protein
MTINNDEKGTKLDQWEMSHCLIVYFSRSQVVYTWRGKEEKETGLLKPCSVRNETGDITLADGLFKIETFRTTLQCWENN